MKKDTNKTEHKNANEEIDEQIVAEDTEPKKVRRIDCPMKEQEKILRRILKIVDNYVTLNHRQCQQNRITIDHTIDETVDISILPRKVVTSWGLALASSAQLKLATTGLKLATQSPGLLTQPAVAGAGSMGELQLRIY